MITNNAESTMAFGYTCILHTLFCVDMVNTSILSAAQCSISMLIFVGGSKAENDVGGSETACAFWRVEHGLFLGGESVGCECVIRF